MSVLGDIWTNGCDCSLLRNWTSNPCKWDGVSWHGVPAKRSWADLRGSWVLLSPVTQYSNKETSPATELWRTNFSSWCCHRAYRTGLCWLMKGQDGHGKAGQGRQIQLSHVLPSMTDDAFCICVVYSLIYLRLRIYIWFLLKASEEIFFYFSTSVG